MSKKLSVFYRVCLVCSLGIISFILFFSIQQRITTSKIELQPALSISYQESEYALNNELEDNIFISPMDQFELQSPTPEPLSESPVLLINNANQNPIFGSTPTPPPIEEPVNETIFEPTSQPYNEIGENNSNILIPESSLQSVSTYSIPELVITNITETSIVIQAVYPVSGAYGNGLAIRDKSTGHWNDIFGSYYATNGTYIVNTLKPANSYDVQLLWYTDATHTWTRQDIIQTFKTKSYEPSIHILDSTETNVTIDVVYPVSDAYGNGLFLHDHVTNQWLNITPDWYTQSGEYSVTGLTPGRNYSILQVWMRDYNNDWLRREILKPFSTNPKIRYFYDTANRIDYIILNNNQTVEFEYDNNGNLISRNVVPTQ
ncbi:hypothetical protein PAT3040_03987 [Paenibacillus agaridevorans]|uniref:Uncharacterized protein n=1 Tax=Paenibacillus agaridevorans TaxID=171404 RepID=A0A2R5EZU4_9BACL|nr:hypothetical protein [Paenibacillus agaridevorans]GBG09343.1 hypothetical protein PAT3040_03987 [Paenibacillus agaridevorans]